MYKYLTDIDFLNTIYKEKIKTLYTKITLLDWNTEVPIQDIQGLVKSGNLNLDGSSAIRRTMNLSFVVSDEQSDLNSLRRILTINKKFKVEVGYKNTFDNFTQYTKEDIIWFPLGVFVLINPTITRGVNETSVSLQLKDKMCLLNGECGGTISASTRFDEYETLDSQGNYITEKPTFYQIIQELVNHFGQEQLSKIIIEGLDTRVRKAMKWIGEGSLFKHVAEDGQTRLDYEPTGAAIEYVYGDPVGYVYTDFICTATLMANAGDTVVTILDKIKSMLGNFEYFYDVDGYFHFREIQNYLNTRESSTMIKEMSSSDYLVDINRGKASYELPDALLVTSYSNDPRFNQVRNDFVVWGIRETVTGNTLPIRYHLAIDKKPELDGTSYPGIFIENEQGNTEVVCPKIFDSASLFPRPGAEEIYYYSEEDKTVYRWTEVIKLEDDETGSQIEVRTMDYEKVDVNPFTEITPTDWRTALYLQGATSAPYATYSNDYYAELKNEWPKLYDLKKGEFKEEAVRHPDDLDFFLDFIDVNTELSEFNISNIGRRTKVVNDNNVNCLFEIPIPQIMLIETDQPNTENDVRECKEKGQPYVLVDTTIYNQIAIATAQNSAYNVVRDLLYQYTKYNESVTINTLPLYHLDVNTILKLNDATSGIQGNYLINSISVPLDVSGNMSISATKVLERI